MYMKMVIFNTNTYGVIPQLGGFFFSFTWVYFEKKKNPMIYFVVSF